MPVGLLIFVGLDDVLNQPVADHIFLGKEDEPDALDILKNRFGFDQAGGLFRGRSIWVMSPVITAFELKPMRVRNIFICSEVVFWASSRMTNASFSVRPRMKARGPPR